eukprot:TRINITY_DN2940_c0_g1_i1.p1 TRINITY_DN2940_c0_g1~~TRINITY_DN2940_c0_g1_i1.p1  ORF type:complete len:267 (+),score=74.03 TRINITY_DN2940_c0_g1_i1:205-1005(+)
MSDVQTDSSVQSEEKLAVKDAVVEVEESKGADVDWAKFENHFSHRSPWLRALIMGAGDGLVSVAALMFGVGGGSDSRHTLILAGLSALIGGALSMAVGEYISVFSQKDTEMADLAKEKFELEHAADKELKELAMIYQERGLSKELAREVARELTEKDALRAHARDELGIDMDELSDPLQAAGASFCAFVTGAAIPLLAGAFWTNQTARLISMLIFTSFGLLAFGALGAKLGGAPMLKASVRMLIGGLVAMGITFGIGKAFGSSSLG